MLRGIYYRFVDREWTRPVVFPTRSEGDEGAWNRWVGMTGERLAGKFLWANGKKVLYRNFRVSKGGEIDIVFRDGDTLVFGEVKTRTSAQFGRPAQAVDREKEGLIIRGANAWLRELNQPEVLFRFDIIEIILTEGEPSDINLIEGAFSTPQVGLGM
ncbi:MAG: YraN family protein [Verrucomicrobiota bacterium]